MISGYPFYRATRKLYFIAQGGSSTKADDYTTALSDAQITCVSDSPVDIFGVSRVESVNDSMVKSVDVPRVGSVDVSSQENSVDPDFHKKINRRPCQN